MLNFGITTRSFNGLSAEACAARMREIAAGSQRLRRSIPVFLRMPQSPHGSILQKIVPQRHTVPLLPISSTELRHNVDYVVARPFVDVM